MLILIGVLVLGVIITRDRDEEVERDIFEYCLHVTANWKVTKTAVQGQFQLAKARLQFHECHACGESIPDLMENCAYCGAPQDVASFFEQRKRIERKVEVEVPSCRGRRGRRRDRERDRGLCRNRASLWLRRG